MLDKTGFMTEDKNGIKDETDPILVVHPNYVPGEQTKHLINFGNQIL